MKRLIIYLSFLAGVFGFSQTIVAQDTPGTITFNKTVHDFGIFDIKDGKKSYEFKFRNTGKTPVVIQTVISSCGCTTPSWTKNPVKPGEEGVVKVEYLNDQGAFPFEKTLSVYLSGSQRPIILRIRGIVKDKNFRVSDSFPYKAGSLRFKSGNLDAGFVARNIVKEITAEAYNASSKPLKVSAVNLPKGIKVEFLPNPIPRESMADMKISIDPKLAGDWGTNKSILSFNVNGTNYVNNKITLSFIIIDNFTGITREQISNSALPVADNSTASAREVKRGSQSVTYFEIKNYGNRDLIIYKAESDDPDSKIDFISPIKPGKTAKVTISTNTRNKSGNYSIGINLITNSPSRPVMTLKIEGKVI